MAAGITLLSIQDNFLAFMSIPLVFQSLNFGKYNIFIVKCSIISERAKRVRYCTVVSN